MTLSESTVSSLLQHSRCQLALGKYTATGSPRNNSATMTDSVVRHRRFSLVHQASMEKQLNEGVKRKNTLRQRDQLGAGILRGKKILQQLNDEGVELIWGAADKKYLTFSVVLSSDCSLAPFLTDLVESFSQAGVHILHLETRERRLRRGEQVNEGNTPGWDILAECGGTKEQMVSAAAALTASNESLRAIRLYRHDRPETPWFPRHVSDLDKCSNCLTKYEPTVDERHPGFGDEKYIARRAELNNMSSSYRHGDPIPVVEYTPEEHATWKAVYEKLRTLHITHTCDTYRKNLHQLEEEGVLSPERIPQLKDVNKFLMKKTGFMLRPCAGLLSARDFLASLAFRVFQTTQYLRHHAHPHHCPEPDLIHELLGHVPMFADEGIAQMSQDIGLMSLGASDEQIERLSTVYWFIVEFGLCKEEGRLKAIGAGLLSAYGELEHACSEVPAHQDFDPSVTALQTYEDADYQPLYFVADSIQDALGKLRAYALTMDRGFNVQYDPYTQSVAVIHSVSDLTSMLDRFRLDFAAVAQSIDYIRKHKKM